MTGLCTSQVSTSIYHSEGLGNSLEVSVWILTHLASFILPILVGHLLINILETYLSIAYQLFLE